MKFYALCLSLLIVGCSTQPTPIEDAKKPEKTEKKVEPTNTAVISSRCNSECQKLIGKQFDLYTGFGSIYEIGPSTLQAVDGHKGRVTYQCPDCVSTDHDIYNDVWTYNYAVSVPPGEHSVTLLIQRSDAAKREPKTLELNLAADRTYFVGQIASEDSGRSGYRWSPVVVDLQSMKMVYPPEKEKLHWLKW